MNVDLNNKFRNYTNYLKKITELSKVNHYSNSFEENKKKHVENMEWYKTGNKH